MDILITFMNEGELLSAFIIYYNMVAVVPPEDAN
jgi:hypothetical protein